MNTDTIFCCAAAIVCLLYAIISGIDLLRTRQHTVETTGTIVDIARLPNPHAKTHLNAHWATISYSVNSRRLISENRVQVAKTALVGNPVASATTKRSPRSSAKPHRSAASLPSPWRLSSPCSRSCGTKGRLRHATRFLQSPAPLHRPPLENMEKQSQIKEWTATHLLRSCPFFMLSAVFYSASDILLLRARKSQTPLGKPRPRSAHCRG